MIKTFPFALEFQLWENIPACRPTFASRHAAMLSLSRLRRLFALRLHLIAMLSDPDKLRHVASLLQSIFRLRL